MSPSPLFDRATASSCDEMRNAFRWDLPERFNLAKACVDDHEPGKVGLVAVDTDGCATSYSFGQLSDWSGRLASGLRSVGVSSGDRVAVLVPQSLETGLAHLAIWRLGAISVPLSALFGPEALRHRLVDSGAKLAIVAPECRAKVAEATPDLPVIETGPELAALVNYPRLGGVAPTALDDPAFLIYTSGTTGPPKGALHGHRSLFGHLAGFELVYDFAPQESDVIWSPADWAWIAGLMDVLVPAWYHGIPVVTAVGGFEPARAIDLMVSQQVTLTFLPPTALKLMRAADVSSSALRLRAVLTGGESLGAELLSWARSTLRCRVNEGYGQTEANLVVGNCDGLWPVKPGSMGRALPGHEVVVLAEDGRRIIDGSGELAVAANDPVVMLGYWRNPEATAAKVVDGWVLTGDICREDADGYIWFESRKDDLINSRGYRIGPGEIEECLLGHPAVALSAVVGVPDDLHGSVPVAFVVLRDGFEACDGLADELRDHIRSRLAAHEVPRRVEFLDELPRTTTGKIMRRELRDAWLTGARGPSDATIS